MILVILKSILTKLVQNVNNAILNLIFGQFETKYLLLPNYKEHEIN